MPCKTISLPNGGMAVVCSRGRKNEKSKVWAASLFDTDGSFMKNMRIEAADQETALRDAVAQSKGTPGAFMVRIGKAERLVCG